MIVVFADFPVLQDYIHGGLQRRLRYILEAFTRVGSVVIFCAEGSNLRLAGCTCLPVYSADGALPDTILNIVLETVGKAQVVISIETSLDLEFACPTILVLGGMAYDWSEGVVDSRRWDTVIVPSPFVQHQLSVRGIESRLIPNGYDWTEFRRTSPQTDMGELRRRAGHVLISPHRPEIEKGHREAILLTRDLLGRGVDCTLLIPVQNFLPSDSIFYSQMQNWERTILPAGHVIYHPWVMAARMAEYYSLADLTLALGVVEEGFGAFAVESIGCGTPVLARDRGAVTELFPSDHGLYLTSCRDMDQVAGLAQSILQCPLDVRETALRRGRAYIEAHYGVERMLSAYLDLVSKWTS